MFRIDLLTLMSCMPLVDGYLDWIVASGVSFTEQTPLEG